MYYTRSGSWLILADLGSISEPGEHRSVPGVVRATYGGNGLRLPYFRIFARFVHNNEEIIIMFHSFFKSAGA